MIVLFTLLIPGDSFVYVVDSDDIFVYIVISKRLFLLFLCSGKPMILEKNVENVLWNSE